MKNGGEEEDSPTQSSITKKEQINYVIIFPGEKIGSRELGCVTLSKSRPPVITLLALQVIEKNTEMELNVIKGVERRVAKLRHGKSLPEAPIGTQL